MFTLKPRTVGGQKASNEWSVLYNGNNLGRIIGSDTGRGMIWQWGTSTKPAFRGAEKTYGGARRAIKAAVLSLPLDQRIRHVSPGDIQRAEGTNRGK